MKTKQSKLTVAIFNFLKEKGAQTAKKVHNFLTANHKQLSNCFR